MEKATGSISPRAAGLFRVGFLEWLGTRPVIPAKAGIQLTRPWIPACEFVNFSLLEVSVVGMRTFWCVAGLTFKVIGNGFISGLSAFAALAGGRASDIRAASTGQRGPTQQVVGDGHE